MTNQLWSDERIQQEASSEFWSGRREPNVRKCAALLKRMRDDYERVHFSALDRIRAEMQEARAVPATEKYAAGLLRALEILLESEESRD